MRGKLGDMPKPDDILMPIRMKMARSLKRRGSSIAEVATAMCLTEAEVKALLAPGAGAR